MISIIITYYTGLNILKSNLSLLMQTNLDNIEIIIVNDNPAAQLTTEILSEFNEIPLNILTMPHNGGYAAAKPGILSRLSYEQDPLDHRFAGRPRPRRYRPAAGGHQLYPDRRQKKDAACSRFLTGRSDFHGAASGPLPKVAAADI